MNPAGLGALFWMIIILWLIHCYMTRNDDTTKGPPSSP